MAAKISSKVVLAIAVVSSILLTGLSASATGASAETTSSQTQPAQFLPSAVFVAPTPTITGNLSVGSTLTANVGTWSPTPTTLTFQWKRNGTPIANLATGSTYKLNAYDRGCTITVTVSGVKSGYTTLSMTSSATATISLGLLAAPLPTITGTTAVGQTLSVNLGAWNPAADSYTYQWKRNGIAIANNATGSTYRLNAFDRGTAISVTVTGNKNGYAALSKTSAATRAIAYGTITAPNPTFSGDLRVGSTLTAWMGIWSITPDFRTFVWYRNGEPIPYATGPTYDLTVDDAGAAISVAITGGKSGYTQITRLSAQRSEWQTTMLSFTVSAWSLFQNCFSVGDSYRPIQQGDIWGDGQGVRIYSSGFGDFMAVECGMQLQGKPTAWNVTFNSSWKGDAGSAFLYVANDPQSNASSWNANMWFPFRDMYVYGENITTPTSYASYGGAVYFTIMSEDWASLYMKSVTVTYITIL